MLERFSKLTEKQKTLLALGVFAILIVIFYGNTLLNGFVMDDQLVIEENPYVQSLEYLPKVVTGCIWEYDLSGCEGLTREYRPMKTLLFLLTYQVSSQPWFFHLVNLVYFFIAAFLLFLFTKSVTKNIFASFLAGLFFIASPINTEVLNFLNTASELLLVIFTLAALLAYMHYRKKGSASYLFFVSLFYFFALLSKEPAFFIVPILLLALDLLILRIHPKQLFTVQELKKYGALLIPAVVYLGMRGAVLGGPGTLTSQSKGFETFSWAERINIFFNSFSFSMGQIIYPNLIFLQDFKIDAAFMNGRFFFSLFVFLAFIFLLYVFVKNKKRIAAFSLIWLFIFYVPMLILFYVVEGNIYAERYLFGPGIGFSLLMSSFLAYFVQEKELLGSKHGKHFSFLLEKIQPRKTRRIIVVSLVSFFLIFSLVRVFERNQGWKDNLTFYQTTLEKNPAASTIRGFLADELRDAGDWEGAKREYEELLQRDPDYWGRDRIYNNLAEYHRQKGELDTAETYYYRAIESSKGTNYKAYNNLGAFYIEQEQYIRALANFCQAIFADPQAPEPSSNINRIASLIQEADTETISNVFADITTGGIMQKSEQEILTYTGRDCSGDMCLFSFVARFSPTDIVLSFLIMGSVSSRDVFLIENSSLNPQTGEIVLGAPLRYRYQDVSFVFPTCNGVYYEATAEN